MSIEAPDAIPVLRVAAGWRLLGLLLERPRPGWHAEVRALTDEIGRGEIREAAGEALATREEDYLGLFGPGGLVSPREVAYRGFADPGRLLSDLAGLYHAFGYAPNAEDPADHVAVETGFVGFLHLKEAYALARSDAEGVAETRRVRALFLEEHLGGFAGELARRTERTQSGHLARATDILRRRCPEPREPLRVVPRSGGGPIEELSCPVSCHAATEDLEA